MCRDGPSGEALLLLTALVSIQLARGKSAQELELLSAFFEVLGDNLALIATRLPAEGENCASSDVNPS